MYAFRMLNISAWVVQNEISWLKYWLSVCHLVVLCNVCIRFGCCFGDESFVPFCGVSFLCSYCFLVGLHVLDHIVGTFWARVLVVNRFIENSKSDILLAQSTDLHFMCISEFDVVFSCQANACIWHEYLNLLWFHHSSWQLAIHDTYWTMHWYELYHVLVHLDHVLLVETVQMQLVHVRMRQCHEHGVVVDTARFEPWWADKRHWLELCHNKVTHDTVICLCPWTCKEFRRITSSWHRS